jgi:hypothetical protein
VAAVDKQLKIVMVHHGGGKKKMLDAFVHSTRAALFIFLSIGSCTLSRPEIALFIFGDYRELRHLYEKLFVFIFSLSTEPCYEK